MSNIKQKVTEQLKDFFCRNRDYAVELDVNDIQTHTSIGRCSISMTRECSYEDDLLSLSWKNNECIYEV